MVVFCICFLLETPAWQTDAIHLGKWRSKAYNKQNLKRFLCPPIQLRIVLFIYSKEDLLKSEVNYLTSERFADHTSALVFDYGTEHIHFVFRRSP